MVCELESLEHNKVPLGRYAPRIVRQRARGEFQSSLNLSKLISKTQARVNIATVRDKLEMAQNNGGRKMNSEGRASNSSFAQSQDEGGEDGAFTIVPTGRPLGSTSTEKKRSRDDQLRDDAKKWSSNVLPKIKAAWHSWLGAGKRAVQHFARGRKAGREQHRNHARDGDLDEIRTSKLEQAKRWRLDQKLLPPFNAPNAPWANYCGKPKGLKQVLFERGLFNPGTFLKASTMRRSAFMTEKGHLRDGEVVPGTSMNLVLGQCHDFLAETTLLEQLIVDLGHVLQKSPKCHPELAGVGIEYCWGKAKYQYRHINTGDQKEICKKQRERVVSCLAPRSSRVAGFASSTARPTNTSARTASSQPTTRLRTPSRRLRTSKLNARSTAPSPRLK